MKYLLINIFSLKATIKCQFSNYMFFDYSKINGYMQQKILNIFKLKNICLNNSQVNKHLTTNIKKQFWG